MRDQAERRQCSAGVSEFHWQARGRVPLPDRARRRALCVRAPRTARTAQPTMVLLGHELGRLGRPSWLTVRRATQVGTHAGSRRRVLGRGVPAQRHSPWCTAAARQQRRVFRALRSEAPACGCRTRRQAARRAKAGLRRWLSRRSCTSCTARVRPTPCMFCPWPRHSRLMMQPCAPWPCRWVLSWLSRALGSTGAAVMAHCPAGGRSTVYIQEQHQAGRSRVDACAVEQHTAAVHHALGGSVLPWQCRIIADHGTSRDGLQSADVLRGWRSSLVGACEPGRWSGTTAAGSGQADCEHGTRADSSSTLRAAAHARARSSSHTAVNVATGRLVSHVCLRAAEPFVRRPCRAAALEPVPRRCQRARDLAAAMQATLQGALPVPHPKCKQSAPLRS
jgi:hypothetical protein